MKILHLLASPYFTGPAELVAQLALAQRELGHAVAVAIDRKRTTTTSEELAAPRLQALGLLDDGGLELSVKSSPAAVLRDLRLLRQRRVDVVHAHFSHDHLLLALATPRGAARIRSVHAERSLRWSLPRADGFTVPVSAWKDRLPRRARARARVLPPIVAPEYAPAPDRAVLRRELELGGDPLVGMVSTFQPSRRHLLGVSAFARLKQQRPAARLVLVGDGVELPKVKSEVERRGLAGAVTFAGYRSGPEYVRWLSALDEVWILGLGNDFSGRAAAQARACGVKVLAVSEGALPECADVCVEPTAGEEAIVEASLSSGRREVRLRSGREIAAAVGQLYEEARRSL